MIVPFFDPKRQYLKFKKEIDKSIFETLNSGRYILGKNVKEFENNFSKFIGIKYGIGVNSGTDAIKIALRALEIKTNDEIITVSNTATPTVSAIREVGAIPIFCDIDKYFTIDSSKIEKLITKKTKAVVIVHLYGQACDLGPIIKIVKKYKLKLIEDCAQAIDTEYHGKKVGTLGDISCFSFYPTKNLGAIGDAGMIVTRNKGLADKCMMLRMYGMKDTYFSEIEGFNSRLDEIQAGILNTKLPYLKNLNKRRIEIAKMYLNGIKNPLIELPLIRPNTKHTFHLFVIKTKNRESIIKYLNKFSVGNGIHYPYPVHMQKAYNFLDYKKGSLEATEEASKSILSIPIFPELKNNEVKYIIKSLNDFNG